jgi:hypothetical protein
MKGGQEMTEATLVACQEKMEAMDWRKIET